MARQLGAAEEITHLGSSVPSTPYDPVRSAATMFDLAFAQIGGTLKTVHDGQVHVEQDAIERCPCRFVGFDDFLMWE